MNVDFEVDDQIHAAPGPLQQLLIAVLNIVPYGEDVKVVGIVRTKKEYSILIDTAKRAAS